jgi:hypothetical protein
LVAYTSAKRTKPAIFDYMMKPHCLPMRRSVVSAYPY